MNKRKAIILDLDGVLVNSEHRWFLAEDGKWDLFDVLIYRDTTYQWSRIFLQMVQIYNSVQIIIVTGRGERSCSATKGWLQANLHLFPGKYLLYMRPDGETCADCVLKQGIYELFIRDYFDVLFVVDDKSSNVKMWRNNGLVCLQNADNKE